MSDYVPFEAPSLEQRQKWVVQHSGASRAERRAARAVLPDGSIVRIPKEYREEATNQPYVKDDSSS